MRNEWKMKKISHLNLWVFKHSHQLGEVGSHLHTALVGLQKRNNKWNYVECSPSDSHSDFVSTELRLSTNSRSKNPSECRSKSVIQPMRKTIRPILN